VIGGYYMWLKKAKAECLFYRDDEEGAAVEGSHDGYRRFKDPVTHRRTVRTDKKNRRIVVIDDIECRKSHELEQFFHFHPDCELERITEHEYRIANHDQIIHIRTDERLGSNLFFGSDDPIMGWNSAIFDVKEKTTTLMNHAAINGTSSFTTEILIR
jgi:hypothetical protein